LAKIRIPLLDLNASGGLRIITEVANVWAATGHQVEILAPDFAASPHFPLHQNVCLKRVSVWKEGWLGQGFFLLYMAIFSCRETDVCLATYYLTPFPIWFSWWFNRRKCKLVYLIQHYEPLSQVMLDNRKPAWVKAILYRIARWGYRLPFQQLAVSEWIKEQVGNPMLIVISNGVDNEVFFPAELPPPHDKLTIGAIGRTGPTKGFPLLIEALKPFTRVARVRILSDETLNLPEGMEHLRPTREEDIVRFYQECTIFVFASQLEGFGLPPLEAMACGAAVITTDCGGVRTFANEQNSLIVPPDDIEALTQAIQRLLTDEELRRQLREAGVKTAQQFTASRMRKQYAEVIKHVINR
jgi:glycosyltransferase involved in cell wall biosynthesis